MAGELATPTDRRIVLGLLAQPFLAFGLGAAIAAFRISTDSGRFAQPLDAVIGVGMAVAIAAAILCVVALPVIFWLRERGQVTFGRALLTGFVLGNVPTVLIIVSAVATGNWRGTGIADVAGPSGLSSFVGIACAGLFWFIACRPERLRVKRPDRA
jgi:hypothetical protein